jgi:uncharacterized protein
MGVKIVSKKIKLKKPVVIEGFPGVGLVGSIAAKYLSQQTNAKQIGFIESPHLPPVSFIVKGEVYNPIRIYEAEKDNLIIVESEFPVPGKLVNEIGERLGDWSKEINAEKVICLEGINAPQSKSSTGVFAITSDHNVKTPKSMKKVETGFMIGVSAALMLQCKEIKMPGLCLMAETHTSFPDGLAAAALIKELNKLLNLNVNTTALENEAKVFEEKIKSLVEKAKSLQPAKKDDKVIYG